MGERTLTWLHLSDLHRCSTRDGGSAEIVLTALREDLRRMRDEHGLSPDLLFFTGDAAFGRLPNQDLESQFLEAAEWLESVRVLFGLNSDRVFVVPGNHDVDRTKVTPKETAWLRSLAERYDSAQVNDLLAKGGQNWADYSRRLADYGEFLRAFYPHLHQAEKRMIFAQDLEIAGLRVGIAGFNSAWSCGGDSEKGQLWLGANFQLEYVLPKLTDCDLKIALMHHPPSWLVEAEDPGNLRSRLQSHFQVFLHGHEHSVWAEPQPQHIKIAAGAMHDKGGSNVPFGYNFVRWIFPESGAEPFGELWLRHFDSRVDQWGQDTIPGKTDPRGVWPLIWPGKLAPKAVTLPTPNEPAFDGKLVDARPFDVFFAEKIEAMKTGGSETSRIAATPRPKPEVFLSYAWGDDESPEGRQRAEAADRLCDELRRDFVVHRDRDTIKAGESISNYIDKLTHGRYLVALVSDKYLRSPYCMFEIYKIYQACQGEKKQLLERVVPVVLPEVKIARFPDRAQYLEYWSEEAEKYEALLRNPRLRPGEESWKEYRLIRDFANHVDEILVFIADVLMPRKVDDFTELRAALRRKMGLT